LEENYKKINRTSTLNMERKEKSVSEEAINLAKGTIG
jgi:hypothetical protein